MFPIKLRKVIRTNGSKSFEYAPVEIIKHKGSWLTFLSEGEPGSHPIVNYDKLETFVKNELEAIVLECIVEDGVCIADLEIDTGRVRVYISTVDGIDSFSDYQNAYAATVMQVHCDFKSSFNFSWVNRLDRLTTVTVYHKEHAF